MMWILGRERSWSSVTAHFLCFVKAYLILMVALVGLYVVIDALSNLDEFLEEAAESTPDLLLTMGRHYLGNMGLILGRVCGVITILAAIFTVAWMRRNQRPSL